MIIFVECGLFFPFLPGDTLLFAMGLFISPSGDRHLPRQPARRAVGRPRAADVAAFLGNVTGYEIGRADRARRSTSATAGS